jgi:hypothetical protein
MVKLYEDKGDFLVVSNKVDPAYLVSENAFAGSTKILSKSQLVLSIAKPNLSISMNYRLNVS